MSLEDGLFRKVRKDINQDIITDFNRRSQEAIEAGRNSRIIEAYQEKADRLQRRSASLQHEVETARYQAQIAEAGRREMFQFARLILLGALFFCLVLMALLLISGIV